VWKCEECQVGFLDVKPLEYESRDYREMVDGSGSADDYYGVHDKEQAVKLSIMGTNELRGKVIADIGCGAGSFLDLVGNYARETLAVEPCLEYHQELKRKGHTVYSYTSDALEDHRDSVDIAVSFAVIEHVSDPILFLQEIKKLLKPKGFLLLSTPNYDDWLIDFLPGVYDRFFFRQAHIWYFNGQALETLGKYAGFASVELCYEHRFDLSNGLLWIRDGRPTGNAKEPILSCIDGQFKKALEDQGRSDFIYAWFQP
jgi:2-polyprenyl-3-methyl-5-hydroxy-6-metoxy-1,4-benzoquinol methylase